jgi:predicted DCC family thiol-disulfide oxidoreductase YuxK
MLIIVYDGACPFCNHYIQKQRIEDEYGPLILLDARSADERLMVYWQQGYPLDEGMLLDRDGVILFGPDALAALAKMSRVGSPLSCMNQLLAKQKFSRFIYPVFKKLRRVALFFKRTKPLHHPPIIEATKHKAG